MPQPKKKLDHVVRMGLGVMLTSFALIVVGMFLTRPDRSIPPFSIGSQEGTAVAIHVPSWTSDGEIETLVRRFQKVARETRNFGPMKIRPTTPQSPEGSYSRLTIYIFSESRWTAPDVLHRYLAGEDRTLRETFGRKVRGLYRLDGSAAEGRIGPLLDQHDSPATAASSRVLFKGPLRPTTTAPSESHDGADGGPTSPSVGAETGPSPSPLSGTPADLDP